jgi:DNA-binding GntR family transcriptional regulator
MARISAVLKAAGEPLSTAKLESRVVGKATGIRAALVALEVEGYITTTAGPRNARLHHLVAEFIDDEST